MQNKGFPATSRNANRKAERHHRCVESVCSGEAHAYGDAQALRGLALLTDGLARVKADPADIKARLDCQVGSWLSMAPLASGVPMLSTHHT